MLSQSILGSTGISLGACSLQVLTTRTCRRLCPLRRERFPGTFSECPLASRFGTAESGLRLPINPVGVSIQHPAGRSGKCPETVRANSALDFTGAPLLIHSMMRQVPGTSQRSSIRSFLRPTVV
ncbi:hypothetical protein T12_9160 [Trichinella patagoniensis]|uniref:Uncharacterized protein n=1 Tax=Trichinella patagoniensis TaxID=990121 RepID=A0A0V0ZAL2_9BILA|nr:hypothetical protein T12_9160 [Trichinella patagoniensis]